MATVISTLPCPHHCPFSSQRLQVSQGEESFPKAIVNRVREFPFFQIFQTMIPMIPMVLFYLCVRSGVDAESPSASGYMPGQMPGQMPVPESSWAQEEPTQQKSFAERVHEWAQLEDEAEDSYVVEWDVGFTGGGSGKGGDGVTGGGSGKGGGSVIAQASGVTGKG